MKYRHHETPMDWLEEKGGGRSHATFLIWKDGTQIEFAKLAHVAFCGEVSFDGFSEDGHWEQFTDWNWRPFADIEALDSDDPILTTARINAEK